MGSHSRDDTVKAAPKVTQVETLGIDTIPDADRTSTAFDLFRLQFGGANTFATVILGASGIALGLSLWQAAAATVLGVLVGTAFLWPMGLFGPKTGTNNAVSCSAHFGVRGRLLGSFLSLLTAIAFYSISVWVSGDAIVGALVRLTPITSSTGLEILIYGIIGLIVLIVVIYGFQFMLLVNKWVVTANTILFLLAIIAFSGTFSFDYNPGSTAYALGSFWPTFILAGLIVMGNPISFGAFLGDWARYIPRDTPTRKLVAATVGAQLSTLVPALFGVATATIVAGKADYVVALVQAAPLWYATLLIVVAFLGGLSTGTTALYGTGLDFSSVFPRFSRVQATIAIGTLAFVFILVGRLFLNLVGAVNAFIGAIVVATTPWMVIMAIGYFVHRGQYDPRSLQVFNRGETGGSYWYAAGINWRGIVAWLAAAIAGLLFANYPPVIVGPFANAAGGVDLSLVIAIVTAAVLYIGSLVLFPEPSYSFGPDGPRIVRSAPAAAPSIQSGRIRTNTEAPRKASVPSHD